MARDIICQLGKMITSRVPYQLGLKKLNEDDPEYYILDLLCSDELAAIMLKMGLRKPKTLEEIAEITGTEPKHLEEVLTDAAKNGAPPRPPSGAVPTTRS